jgi:hypothetical protein
VYYDAEQKQQLDGESEASQAADVRKTLGVEHDRKSDGNWRIETPRKLS